MTLKIRQAVKEDCLTILEYIKKLADFEKAPEEVINSIENLEKDGFGEKTFFHAAILEWSGKPCGFLLYYYGYSTWKGKALYLEDLFVDPTLRGNGIGKEAMKYLASIAMKNECQRFHWQALDWNTPAIDFYKTLGAEIDSEWVNCRLHVSEIRNLV